MKVQSYFVGREREMEYAKRQLYMDADTRSKSILVIVGERGIGKTAFLFHLLKDIDKNDTNSVILPLSNGFIGSDSDDSIKRMIYELFKKFASRQDQDRLDSALSRTLSNDRDEAESTLSTIPLNWNLELDRLVSEVIQKRVNETQLGLLLAVDDMQMASDGTKLYHFLEQLSWSLPVSIIITTTFSGLRSLEKISPNFRKASVIFLDQFSRNAQKVLVDQLVESHKSLNLQKEFLMQFVVENNLTDPRSILRAATLLEIAMREKGDNIPTSAQLLEQMSEESADRFPNLTKAIDNRGKLKILKILSMSNKPMTIPEISGKLGSKYRVDRNLAELVEDNILYDSAGGYSLLDPELRRLFLGEWLENRIGFAREK